MIVDHAANMMFTGREIYENVNPCITKLYAGELLVLDVGCSSGALGAWIKQVTPAAVVHGVDISSEAGMTAKKRLDAFWCLDLDLAPLQDNNILYDLIILGDVLEHLKRPDHFLTSLHRHLKPEGRVIVSIPNIANFRIRLDLLRGEFCYKEAGILDRTHLRFFTWSSFENLIDKSGFIVEHRDFIAPLPGALVRTLTHIFFRLLAVQFIVKLKRS